MLTGIVVGFGLGMTLTTVMYAVLILRAGKSSAQNAKTVEALLIRKAEASERMADALEKSNAVGSP
jgi:hypothetical protein